MGKRRGRMVWLAKLPFVRLAEPNVPFNWFGWHPLGLGKVGGERNGAEEWGKAEGRVAEAWGKGEGRVWEGWGETKGKMVEGDWERLGKGGGTAEG